MDTDVEKVPTGRAFTNYVIGVQFMRFHISSSDFGVAVSIVFCHGFMQSCVTASMTKKIPIAKDTEQIVTAKHNINSFIVFPFVILVRLRIAIFAP
jgi:hypothetical protein